MNNIPNTKISALHDTLVSIDEKLFLSREYEDENKIRALIDKRRHATAQLQTEIEANPKISQYSSDNIYYTNLQTQEFIDAWCSRVQKASQDILIFRITNFAICSLIIFCPKSGILIMT